MGGIIELAPSNALSSEQAVAEALLSVQSLQSISCSCISQWYFSTVCSYCISQLYFSNTFLNWRGRENSYQCNYCSHSYTIASLSCISELYFLTAFLNSVLQLQWQRTVLSVQSLQSLTCIVHHISLEVSIWIFRPRGNAYLVQTITVVTSADGVTGVTAA